MPYAVTLRFDQVLAGQIEAHWQRAAAATGAADLPTGTDEPHVSLAVYDEGPIDPAALVALVEGFASTEAPLAIGFSSLGIFPSEENVLFLAPVVTAALLRLHGRWHEHAAALAPACWAHYVPGSWVPHCTLAMRWPVATLLPVIGELRSAWTPLRGELRALALIRAEPIVTLAEHPLGGAG